MKVNGAIELPYDFSVGFAGLWGSKFAYSKTRPVDPYGEQYVDPRGAFRADDTINLDLELRKAFQLGPLRTSLIATIQNVTSEESVTEVCENEDGCGAVDFGGALNHARPRRYQVGLRVEF